MKVSMKSYTDFATWKEEQNVDGRYNYEDEILMVAWLETRSTEKLQSIGFHNIRGDLHDDKGCRSNVAGHEVMEMYNPDDPEMLDSMITFIETAVQSNSTNESESHKRANKIKLLQRNADLYCKSKSPISGVLVERNAMFLRLLYYMSRGHVQCHSDRVIHASWYNVGMK